jgi:uncharacterized protein YkwD
MKKAFFRKMVGAVIVSATITTLLPLGVSAQWRQNYDESWSYTYGNTIVKGWRNVSGIWYYFDLNGKMKTGWVYYKGSWYYLSNSGVMQKGWIYDNGIWYYLDSAGAMETGWVKEDGKWYYLDEDGEMQTGNINIGDKTYSFNRSGEWQQTWSNSIQAANKQVNGSAQTYRTVVDVNGLTKLPQTYSISVQGSAENKILELMNQKRTEAGLQPLTLDNTLIQIARYKSNHMIQYNYFDHTTPDGTKWTSWLDAIGYQYTTTGENIAYNNYDPFELFNQWWNSSGHRENMMNSSYTKVGIGVIYGNSEYMGTQTFSN